MAITFSPAAVVEFSPAADGELSPAADGELSPAAVTQLTERQFPHAGVPEIVNCRSASYVTSGCRRESHRMRNFNFSHIAPPALLCMQVRDFAAWLQGNAQVTISGTPA